MKVKKPKERITWTHRGQEKRVPVDELKDNYLYWVSARNLKLAVYRKSTKGYLGIREKFSNRFIFEEYDWDLADDFKTCTPLEEICECPVDIDLVLDSYLPSEEREKLFVWLDAIEVEE